MTSDPEAFGKHFVVLIRQQNFDYVLLSEFLGEFHLDGRQFDLRMLGGS